MILLIYTIIIIVLWFIGWISIDNRNITNFPLSFIFKWYDMWVGLFWDSKKKYLYIFPLPFFGFIIKL